MTIMDESADWSIHGRAGLELGIRHSLRVALRAAFGYEAIGRHVFAICRQPGDTIILFREQMERIAVDAGIPLISRREAA